MATATDQRAHYTPKSGGTKEYNNKLKEKLTRTPIWAPVSLYFILSAGLLYYAIAHNIIQPLLTVGLFFAGWFFFTFLEYAMHRFLFHMKIYTKTRETLQYHFHGVHHEYPKDKSRLAMPIPVSIVLAVAFFGLFWVLMNVYTYGFLPGVLTGYATYLFVHYIVHAYPPPNNFFKALWVNHAIHHYKDDSVVFGVSSQFWDMVFGTMPKK